MITLTIIVLYSILIIWAMVAVLLYQRQLTKEKGETLVAVKLNIVLPFLLLLALAYGTLFLQPLVYSNSHHLPTTFNVKAILRQLAMLIQLVAIVFYPMYAWGIFPLIS
ncbi:hypothetical protein [Lactococcus allomyrinae]|uniref:Uncharacterized protein n=1 Tax=Lactococcus allomyrinae TaxID=2419773 RepID=A0A387BCU2_9LACT|nr:hypothetical protein [Lactococcus allomyrinae]AYF99841.1 hypothetical protein D7I46_01330 [Lactococcus allomyrinae]